MLSKDLTSRRTGGIMSNHENKITISYLVVLAMERTSPMIVVLPTINTIILGFETLWDQYMGLQLTLLFNIHITGLIP